MRSTLLVASFAAACVAGCGSGLSDGLGEMSVTRAVEPPREAEITLAQARLRIAANSLTAPATITIRRLPGDGSAAAIGPIFEVNVQGGGFNYMPVLEIAVSGTTRVPAEALVVAHYATEGSTAQWLPLSSGRKYDARAHTVSGDLTMPIADRTLRFGTLAWCGRDGARVDCLPGQSCHGGACQ